MQKPLAKEMHQSGDHVIARAIDGAIASPIDAIQQEMFIKS